MSGKYGSSSFAVLLVDGYNFLANKVKNFSYEIESILESSHGLGDAFEAFTPVGMQKAALTQDGAFFDDSTNLMHDALKASVNVSRIVCFAVGGNTIGQPFVGVQGAYGMKYGVLGQVGALTKANAAYMVSGQVDRGTILQTHAAKTADWNTKTLGTPVDYTLDTAQAAVAITSNSQANPSVVTTPVPHGLTTGDIILISGVATSSPTINGERTVTVISATTFSVPVDTSAGAAGTGGSFVRANTSFGAVGYLQVSAFSGFSGFVGKIRDSADDTTYADLISFTNVTSAPTAQRVTNGVEVVDRYLSVNGDVTGSGSITVFVGLARLLS